MPLATGEVKPEGIALSMILGSRGSWPARAAMLRRAVQDPHVQGGEWSMAQYLYRIDKGDRRYVGLPAFPLRNFTAGGRDARRRRARKPITPTRGPSRACSPSSARSSTSTFARPARFLLSI